MKFAVKTSIPNAKPAEYAAEKAKFDAMKPLLFQMIALYVKDNPEGKAELEAYLNGQSIEEAPTESELDEAV